MADYEQLADQAIAEGQWHEAADLLGAAAVRPPEEIDMSYRMQLRRIALPLNMAAVRYEEQPGDMSGLTDATATEVHEEVVDLLGTVRQDYYENYNHLPRPHAYSKRERRLIGIMAEMTLFGLCTRARAMQFDDLLVVPSTQAQDTARGGFGNDFGMYSPRVTWHDNPRTPIQSKHFVRTSDIHGYHTSVVVAAYKGTAPEGVDKYSVTFQKSVSANLAGECTWKPEEIDGLLDQRYLRLRSLVEDWPIRRERFLAKAAEADLSKAKAAQSTPETAEQ